MLMLMAAAAVLPLAIVMWIVHLVAAALFPRTPPVITIVTGFSVLASTPVAYFVLADVGREAAAEAGMHVSHVEGFFLTLSAAVIVVLIYLLMTLPRAQRRGAQAQARVGLWYALAETRSQLCVAQVNAYAMTRRVNGWAEVQVGAHAWTVWLTGRCNAGELVLLECAPDTPAARVVDRLTVRETARYTRRNQPELVAA